MLCGILSECFNVRGFYPGRCPGLICSVLSERFNALVFYPNMRAVTLALREVEKPSNILILAHATLLHAHPSNKRQANCPERTTHTSLGQRPRNGIRPMISVLTERCINDTSQKNLSQKTRSWATVARKKLRINALTDEFASENFAKR